MKKSGSSLYILEKYRTIKFDLHNSTGNILALNQLELKILPENICFQPVDSREFIVGTTHGHLFSIYMILKYFRI